MEDALTSTQHRRNPRRRLAALTVVAAAIGAEAAALRRHGWGLAGEVVVRCRQGHLFTTLWIPGVSVKALRLGWWRVQRCPVGRHWSVVSPVDRSQLTSEQAQAAAQHHDVRLP
jgi:hypothetical protein